MHESKSFFLLHILLWLGIPKVKVQGKKCQCHFIKGLCAFECICEMDGI